jgi:hypothetical protein
VKVTLTVTIDWAALRTAHGNAAHVPGALAGLRGETEDTRKAAYWQLDNHVVLQGNLFEAAPFVADELVRMLDEELPGPTKVLLYRLLYEIRNGYAPDVDTVIHDGQNVPLLQACRQVVGDALPSYQADLTTPDTSVRREVIDLLASLDDRREEVATLLTEARSETRDPATLADLDRCLRELYE